MATFATNVWYELSFNNGQYKIIERNEGDATSVTNNSLGDVFAVDELVRVSLSGYQGTEKILAFTSDGIISQTLDGSFYTFVSSNASYSLRDILVTNTGPFTPVCFVKGTLIETGEGPVAIESLAIGDKVVGSTGLRTVKWIGWRHYHAIALRTPEQRSDCTPVRIHAGALADNQPSQDLRVSPWHHIYIDGVLVRAKDLINGKTVVQEIQAQEFSYYHIELDQFDVIQAHGVYSESWADGGNRDFFQNVDVTTLRPEDKVRRHAPRPGFKALRKASEIAVIHDRIAERAEALGVEMAAKAA
ncbi:Hint domain-containing protein [Bordetella sp. 15P40C-2]|uniref:Hint domain-containing protein n=1 Tax=Bordetella sp. 15P40C-2 TaxID=2572246 RepID=UPI001321CA2A|nr:hypothetical protein [Bordetella sp. 15P40C-2]